MSVKPSTRNLTALLVASVVVISNGCKDSSTSSGVSKPTTISHEELLEELVTNLTNINPSELTIDLELVLGPFADNPKPKGLTGLLQGESGAADNYRKDMFQLIYSMTFEEQLLHVDFIHKLFLRPLYYCDSSHTKLFDANGSEIQTVRGNHIVTNRYNFM